MFRKKKENPLFSQKEISRIFLDPPYARLTVARQKKNRKTLHIYCKKTIKYLNKIVTICENQSKGLCVGSVKVTGCVPLDDEDLWRRRDEHKIAEVTCTLRYL